MSNVSSLKGFQPVDVLSNVSKKIDDIEEMVALVIDKNGECHAHASDVHIESLLMMQATLNHYVSKRVSNNIEGFE